MVPHELITPSRKCLTVIVPVEPVNPVPSVGAVVSSVELILMGGVPERIEKLSTCGLVPPAKLTVNVNRSVVGQGTFEPTVNRNGTKFVPMPPPAAKSAYGDALGVFTVTPGVELVSVALIAVA